jgi:hypothetical protein
MKATVTVRKNARPGPQTRAYLDVNLVLHARDQASPRYRTASACLRDLILRGVERKQPDDHQDLIARNAQTRAKKRAGAPSVPAIL